MHQIIKTLSKVADRYSASRMLTFNAVHVFKTMQLMYENGRASRAVLVRELNVGEGSVKTLVKHLKMYGLAETSKGGMRLSEKGKNLFSKLSAAIRNEVDIPLCSIGLGRFNHAILLKGLAEGIGSGIEQRDFARVMGAKSATTLLYENERFLMPGQTQDSLKAEKRIKALIMKKLRPENGDVIILGSADDKKTAELATKYAALMTVSSHHRHL